MSALHARKSNGTAHPTDDSAAPIRCSAGLSRLYSTQCILHRSPSVRSTVERTRGARFAHAVCRSAQSECVERVPRRLAASKTATIESSNARAHSADARATHLVFGDVIVASATVWPWTSSSAIQTAAVRHGTAHRCWRPSHTCAGGSRSLFVAPVRNHFSESTDIGCTLCVAA